MALYKHFIPKHYTEDVFKIEYKTLKEQGKDTLFFDLDNTIMSYDQTQISNQYLEFLNTLRNDFKVVIVSNSGYKRVSKACLPHDLLFVHSAKKPFKSGFYKAMKLANSSVNTCVFIGDQMMTDVLGSNRVGLYPILTRPVKQRTDHIFTRLNRKIEKRILKKIKKHMPKQYNEVLKSYAKDIHHL
jgi:HAD superfamily phosphatase (TIGR01668 family)